MESEAFFVVVPPRRGCERSKAPHDSGICWKQFMMRLEDTWFVVAFHSTPMHDPGLEELQSPVRVCVCKGASVLPCLLGCCCWHRRPPALRRSRLRAAPPPRACPPESPWCRPAVAARRICLWRRGALSRTCATRRGPAPGAPVLSNELFCHDGEQGIRHCNYKFYV